MAFLDVIIHRIFGIGKKAVFQKLLKDNSVMQSLADQFLFPNQERELIKGIGTQAMVVLYGGKGTESLASLRHRTLTMKIVSSKSCVEPEHLPPTASSPKIHSLRVYN